MQQFKIGERVMWSGAFGRQMPKPATIVDNTGEKNDEVVYDLDNGHWAYGYQLQPIEETRATR
jgi:hypothetical protein